MGIKVKEIRIRNYRSLKSVDLNLTDSCVIIGANNSGKTSLLRAIQVAFGASKRVNSEDIHVRENEVLPKDRRAIIDVLIVPTDDNNEEVEDFDDIWFQHFGELRSEDKISLNQFVAFRTLIGFNFSKSEYEIERKALIEWCDSKDVENYSEYKKLGVSDKILQAVPIFYMDAKRDIVTEMKEKTSYWGKLVSDVGLNESEINEIESLLNSINDKIIDRSSVLKHITESLSQIAITVDGENDSIKINPVSRKIRDINRGIDISYKDEKSESFPISNHGMGTRSWITFLTLIAHITWEVSQKIHNKMAYCPLVLLEEPEAHLHPQAQRQVFKQIKEMTCQKIISSHSSIIVGQAEIQDIRHISKENGCSELGFINTSEFDDKDFRKIRQEVFKTNGDLLFAKAILLCEGETEEQALPVFFKEYFGYEAFEIGVSIISIDGYGKYKPFLRIAKDLNIQYYILSDGERETIKKISKDVKEVFGDEKEIDEYANIKFLDNECDFEKYLIQEGYGDELVSAMEKTLGDRFLDKFIDKRNNSVSGREKTSEICFKCGQNIYRDIVRNYSGDEGYKKALLDCIHDNKTAYSSIIADIIVDNRKENKIPKIINDLFGEMDKFLCIKRQS